MLSNQKTKTTLLYQIPYVYYNKKVLIFRFDDIFINRTEIKAPNFARPAHPEF